jgi:uncharacterized coiled-coil protein SlyX
MVKPGDWENLLDLHEVQNGRLAALEQRIESVESEFASTSESFAGLLTALSERVTAMENNLNNSLFILAKKLDELLGDQ